MRQRHVIITAACSFAIRGRTPHMATALMALMAIHLPLMATELMAPMAIHLPLMATELMAPMAIRYLDMEIPCMAPMALRPPAMGMDGILVTNLNEY